jgi:transcriptional regulator with XRE-family HTH domain
VAGSSAGRKVDVSPHERLFAVEVDRARAVAGVSQDWVGRRIGLSRSKVSEVCCGRYLPTRETLALLVEALGMDPGRTLRLWQDARNSRDQRQRRDRLARMTPPPVGWDLLPVLPAEVVSLLAAQTRMAEELPYRLPGARGASLSTVYVRQELGSGLEDHQPERRIPRSPSRDAAVGDGPAMARDPGRAPEAHARAAAPRMAMRAPSRPVREALDGNDHVLVTGGPGQGKSTLTLRLAADIAQAWAGRDEDAETVTEGEPPLAEPVVPVRLPARVLAARIDLPMPTALAEAISAEYGSLLTAPVDAGLLADRVAHCRWLLLIDAVDEIADPEIRTRFVRVLSQWIAEPADRAYRLLVTSRPLESGGLAPLHRGATRYELQPFDAKTLRRFVEHWFRDPDDGRRFLGQIRKAHLDELVRVPLLATIAAIVFDQHGDRPLPDNQYDLYEEYLNYLASARRWPDEFGPFARIVRELRTDLLEHLGATRLHADTSLIAAAQTWILERTSPRQRPAGWQADLTAMLRAVGPLVVHGEDIQFLHHTFAEHLAATASARLLPVPFDAENPVWAQAIHAAQYGLATDHGRAVLLHYTHLRPGETDPLILWLHRNSSDFQLMAAELLSQHAPATPEVVDAFLDTARQWAMTSSGAGIFRQATRATHHPRLGGWLRELMHEPKATWSSRIEAATVLCTRLRTGADHAVDLLRTAMEDPTLDLADRFTAAEALAQIGHDQHEAAVRGLRSVLADPAVTGYTLRGAAVALSDAGPEYHAEASGILRRTLGDPTASPHHRVQAAIGLAEIGTEFHEQAASVFRSIAADAGLEYYRRAAAMLALGDLRSSYLESAADLLDDMIIDRSQPEWCRYHFAETLAQLGPEYIQRATAHMLAMLAEPFIDDRERWQAATILAKAHPGHHHQAADHLRRVLSDPGSGVNPRFWAAKGLTELGPDHHNETARELHRLATDPYARDWHGCEAAATLAGLGPRHRDTAIQLLRERARDQMVNADVRVWAVGNLIELGTEFHSEGATILRDIATDPTSDDEDRVTAAVKLAGLDTDFHDHAVNVMRTVIRNPAADASTHRTAAQRLAELGPAYRAEAATALRAVLRDNTNDWISRAGAAESLADLGHEYRAEAAAGIHSIVRRQPKNAYKYQYPARILANFGSELRAEAADTLRAIYQDTTLEPDQRRAAITALAEFGREYHADTVAGLRAILSDPAADADCCQEAATSLVRYGPEHRDESAAVLRAILAASSTPYWTRVSAAEALARLGGQHLEYVITTLLALLAELTIPAELRAEFAPTLIALEGEPRAGATDCLRGVLAEQGTTTRGSVAVIWHLARADVSYREDAAAQLADVLVCDTAATADRCTSAEHLVRLEPGSWQRVTQILRSILVAPLTKPADRLLIVDQLTKTMAISRHERIHTVLAVAHDPTATGYDRGAAAAHLRRHEYGQGTTALEVERELLNDHFAPIRARVANRSDVHIMDAPLSTEKLAALHDVLHGLEFTTADRFDALAALAEFGPDRRQQVADILHVAASDPDQSANIIYKSLIELGQLEGRHRLVALSTADDLAGNLTRDPRQRLAAARAVVTLHGSTDSATALFGAMVKDPTASDRDRVNAASSLAQLEHPDNDEALRWLTTFIHDPRLIPLVRQRAATALLTWRPTARATIGDVLDELAGINTTPPAARWRIATALANLGDSYRDQATQHLLAIMSDTALSKSARIEATATLAAMNSRHLDTSVAVLRTIADSPTVSLAHRRIAQAHLGSLARPYCDQAIDAIRHIAQDPTVSPTNRWRAAHTMVQLRRDTTTEATLAIHEALQNPNASWHTRHRAATTLARISPQYRTEARQALAANLHSPIALPDLT